jgi:hypothetical protein
LAYYRKPNPTGFTPEMEPPPLLPVGVSDWLIHQTGDKTSGAVMGVKSYTVDTNRFNGTIEDLAAFLGQLKFQSHQNQSRQLLRNLCIKQR